MRNDEYPLQKVRLNIGVLLSGKFIIHHSAFIIAVIAVSLVL